MRKTEKFWVDAFLDGEEKTKLLILPIVEEEFKRQQVLDHLIEQGYETVDIISVRTDPAMPKAEEDQH